MKSDAVGYIVVIWIDPGPNLNLNAQVLKS